MYRSAIPAKQAVHDARDIATLHANPIVFQQSFSDWMGPSPTPPLSPLVLPATWHLHRAALGCNRAWCGPQTRIKCAVCCSTSVHICKPVLC